jgi:hypothetical protein
MIAHTLNQFPREFISRTTEPFADISVNVPYILQRPVPCMRNLSSTTEFRCVISFCQTHTKLKQRLEMEGIFSIPQILSSKSLALMLQST